MIILYLGLIIRVIIAIFLYLFPVYNIGGSGDASYLFNLSTQFSELPLLEIPFTTPGMFYPVIMGLIFKIIPSHFLIGSFINIFFGLLQH